MYLKCEYCLVSQVDGWHERKDIEFKYSIEHMIKAFFKRAFRRGMLY
mgnify:CR=1 FL=1